MTRVLLTGATSFLGVSLSRRLLESGCVVDAVVRPTSTLERLAGLPVGIYPGSGDVAHLSMVLDEVHPDCVIHLAGRYVRSHSPGQVAELVDANVRLGAELLEAMTLTGVRRIVTVSSAFQHYDSDGYRPLNLYAASKQAFEAVLAYYADAGLVDPVTLVLFEVYGPGDWRPKLVNAAVDAALSASPLDLSDPAHLLDLIHIDDVVEGFVRAINLTADRPRSGRRYALGSGRPMTVKEIVDTVETVTGCPIIRRWGAYPVPARNIETPWDGPLLPGWAARLGLEDGIATMLEVSG